MTSDQLAQAKRDFWSHLSMDHGIAYLCTLSDDTCYHTIALLAVVCGLCYPHLPHGASEFDVATAFMRQYRPGSRYVEFGYV